MKHTRALKKIVAIILLLILMSSLTGCGFISPGKTDQTYAEWAGQKDTSKLGNGNLFVVEWSDMIGFMITDGGEKLSSAEEATKWWQTKKSFLIPSTNQGIPTSSVNLVRKVAIFMYNTVFNDAYGWGADKPNDYVAYPGTGKSSEKPLNLNPANLIKQIVQQTEAFLSGDNETTNVLSKVTSAIQGISMSILIIMWCINFVSQVVNERFTMESFLKSFMQLMLSIVVVSNSEKFTAVFVSVGNTLIEHLGGETKIGMVALQKQAVTLLQKPIEVSSTAINISLLGDIRMALPTSVTDGNAVTVLIMMLVPMGAIAFCTWNILSAMTIRIFELLARITFAPIPLSFSAQNGFSHETMRYFKGVLGCAAHPALISLGVACISSVGNMVTTIFNQTANSATGVVGVLALSLSYFLLAVYIGQTRRIADEIFAR